MGSNFAHFAPKFRGPEYFKNARRATKAPLQSIFPNYINEPFPITQSKINANQLPFPSLGYVPITAFFALSSLRHVEELMHTNNFEWSIHNNAQFLMIFAGISGGLTYYHSENTNNRLPLAKNYVALTK